MATSYQFCPISGHRLVPAEHGGHMRLACSDVECEFIHWDNPVPIVAAIVEHNEQIVLVRSIGRPAHAYALVAGFLEQAEHPDEAIAREMEEEIGIVPDRCTWLGSYVFERMNQIIFVYHAEVPHLDIRLGTDELDDYRIVPIAALQPWSQGTGPAVRDWLASRGFHPPVVEFGQHL